MRRLLFVVLLLGLGACGDSSTSTPVDTPGGTQPAAGSTQAPTATVATTMPTTVAPATTVGQAAPTIEVLTPGTGAGLRPLLQWVPVEGAVGYVVALSEPGEGAYWAWTGPEDAVYLGGTLTEPPPDTAGPYLHTPMELRVVAFDANDEIVARSEPVLLRP